MIPMVSEPGEIIAARAILAREVELNLRRGTAGPSRVHFGIMIEVPSLLFDLEAVLPLVDFASVGSNDLLQYFFASDRANAKVAGRFDVLSPSFLRALSRSPPPAGSSACRLRCAARSAAGLSKRWR